MATYIPEQTFLNPSVNYPVLGHSAVSQGLPQSLWLQCNER